MKARDARGSDESWTHDLRVALDQPDLAPCQDRVVPKAGSMFEEVPPITDTALVAKILHHWSDKAACVFSLDADMG
jgi:hypothetical protein